MFHPQNLEGWVCYLEALFRLVVSYEEVKSMALFPQSSHSDSGRYNHKALRIVGTTSIDTSDRKHNAIVHQEIEME
jgi:hypothetical protein